MRGHVTTRKGGRVPSNQDFQVQAYRTFEVAEQFGQGYFPGMRVELLAPAGDWECLRAAVANGADAVYFGMPRFNARMRADNFRNDELPAVVAFLHSHGVKAYVALNVLIFTDELPDAVDELRLLHSAGVDAVIIQDVGLAEISRRMFPGLRVHASTQMTITSPEGVCFAESLGVQQVVLARELSLRELDKFPPALPLEVFVHGALEKGSVIQIDTTRVIC
jgi:putative protease